MNFRPFLKLRHAVGNRGKKGNITNISDFDRHFSCISKNFEWRCYRANGLNSTLKLVSLVTLSWWFPANVLISCLGKWHKEENELGKKEILKLSSVIKRPGLGDVSSSTMKPSSVLISSSTMVLHTDLSAGWGENSWSHWGRGHIFDLFHYHQF